MFLDSRSSAARRAIFALTALCVVGGCSHTTPKPERASAVPAQRSSEAADDADRGDEVVGKVDEAQIGSQGPAQIENAIETLDQQTESEPRLVQPLGDSASPVATDGDVFERMRSGFLLSEVDHEWIDREEAWFANHPD